ncbi:uncharacterized protein [Arachis hypogaea]|uniref:uncharacterized protein n=1 Tax=Arachis hypogaea TaxID=3818 RepID=UPI003B20CB2C
MGTSEVNRRQQARSEPNIQQQANSGPNEQQPNRDPTVRFYVSAVQDDDDDDPIYDYHSEDLHTPNSTDDESSKHTFPEFDDDYAFGEGMFELGTRFATIDRFKEVVKDSFIAEGRELRWIKNDRERVRVGCMDDDCPWLVHLSYNKSLQCYQVKTYKNDHTCARDLESNAIDQHWISKKVEKRMSSQPHMRTNEAVDFLREEFSLTAHPKMVYRAVKEAREKIMRNEREQYNNVMDYLFKILRSNHRSRAELCVTPIPQAPPVFDKLSETKESWKWFLTILQEDLGDVQTHGWNFMSDQQKFNNAVVQNLLVMFNGKTFVYCDLYIREVVWDYARCTTIPEFKEQMEKFKGINQGAWEYFSKFEPATWVKAYFSHGPKVDNLTNNMCEVFNSKMVNYRSKHILTMCEEIRCYLMRRMVKHKKLLSDYTGKLAPVQ